VWNVGLRYGWILTRPHGPGFLKGRFEYALDAVPLFLVFRLPTRRSEPVSSLNLKWNFALADEWSPILNSAAARCLLTTTFRPELIA